MPAHSPRHRTRVFAVNGLHRRSLEALRDFEAGCIRDGIPLADFECDHRRIGPCPECEARRPIADATTTPTVAEVLAIAAAADELAPREPLEVEA